MKFLSKKIYLAVQLIGIVSLLVVFNRLEAQDYFFKTLTVNNGLSQNDVSAICQDSYGFIWIGTYDGLNRYDGFSVQSYHKVTSDLNSLPENRITALQEDHQKRLWVGTESGKIAYYCLSKERFYRVEVSLSNAAINDIIIADNGEVLASTSGGILKLNEKKEPHFELIESSRGLAMNTAAKDQMGTIYFAGLDGIFRLENKLLRKISPTEESGFRSIVFDNKNRLIAGSYDGLYYLEGKGGIRKIESSDILSNVLVHTITLDKNGNIWIATEQKGLIQLDSNFQVMHQIMASSIEKRGLLNNSVLDLFCDENNTLWLGNRLGLCYTSLDNVGFESLNLDRFSRPNVRDVFFNRDHLLLGITNNGLFKYQLSSNEIRQVLPEEIKYVREIKKMDDKLYVSTNRGLFISKVGSTEFKEQAYDIDWPENTNSPKNFTCIAQDDHQRLYLGTRIGILVVENDTANWIWEKDPSMNHFQQAKIFALHFEKQDHTLYVGTISAGLFAIKFDDSGNWVSSKQVPLYDSDTSTINNTSVWSFHRSTDGTLWLGTDNGLFLKKQQPNDLFRQVTVEGVVDKKIMRILESREGVLWLSNSQGLIYFQPQDSSLRKFTYDDGLLSSSLTEGAAMDDSNTLYFGTKNGVSLIKPELSRTNTYHPKVLISKFTVHNELVLPQETYFGSVILERNINATDQVVLNHLQNNFTIEFGGNNYPFAPGSTYKYQLQGYDENWNYTRAENRYVSYSNLNPGKYTLILDVASQDGIWSGNPKIIEFKILPAPWKTPLAYFIYLFCIAMIIAGFVYFWNNRQQLNHQIELDKVIINRDKELRELQLRFFTDVAHEFKTPLSLIIAPINDLMNHDLSKKAKQMCLQLVSRNIQRMSSLVSQLLDYGRISEGINILQVSQGDLKKSISDIIMSFQWQAQQQHIDLRLNLNDCIGYFDKDVVEKALYNVLSNAFKYTPNEGTIELRLQVEGAQANIVVSDSGPGIPDEHKANIFHRFYHDKNRSSSGIGLHLTKRLINNHQGSISVADSPLGGALFTLSVPINKEIYSENQLVPKKEATILMPNELEGTSEISAVEEGETILIVEDDYDLREYLKLSLQAYYIVLEAKNGEQGLKIAKKELPDIVITDVMMPVMDGIELCKNLKAENSTSHIPVLMLTAKTGLEYEKSGLDAGAWDYINKPFDSSVLLQKIKNIIDTRNKFKSYLSDQIINLEVKSHYTSYDQKFLANISEIIKGNLDNPDFTVNELAREVGLSRMHLHRKLKALVGESGKNIITKIRIKHAVAMFDQGCDRIQEAMSATGMTSYASFNNNFKRIMGMTASDYMAQVKKKVGPHKEIQI